MFRLPPCTFWLFLILANLSAKESDSGRYGVTASNGAGRAECLADVMVTNLLISEPTKTIVFTDISDDSRVSGTRSSYWEEWSISRNLRCFLPQAWDNF